jgi:hypothetical protein
LNLPDGAGIGEDEFEDIEAAIAAMEVLLFVDMHSIHTMMSASV